MRSYRSTIGGAFAAAGIVLAGAGLVIPIYTKTPSELWTKIAATGFLMQAAGAFLAHLFSADKAAVQKMIEDSNEQTVMQARIAKAEIDTNFVKKSDVTPSGKVEL